MNYAKLYTWVVGALFLTAVGYTLAVELTTKGVTLEAGHKAMHVALGLWAALIVFKGLEPQYRLFALVNGISGAVSPLSAGSIPTCTASTPSTGSTRSCTASCRSQDWRPLR